MEVFIKPLHEIHFRAEKTRTVSGCLQRSFCMAYFHMEMNPKYTTFSGRAFFLGGAGTCFLKHTERDCDPDSPCLNEKGTVFCNPPVPEGFSTGKKEGHSSNPATNVLLEYRPPLRQPAAEGTHGAWDSSHYLD
ncbi:MAG TPA: hypothetical protein VLL74_04105, partial [Methanoregula sp.]|nr:hypothetical protein [Methanoregula sp.]